MKQKTSEKEVQQSILAWLAAKRIFHYRNNSGVMRGEREGGGSYFVRFGATGSPDIIVVLRGRYVGVETKGSGGKQSDEQKQFEIQLTKAGGLYILAASIDDVEKSLINNQLLP